VQAQGGRVARMHRKMPIKRLQGRNKNIVLCAKWNMKQEIGRKRRNAIAKVQSGESFFVQGLEGLKVEICRFACRRRSVGILNGRSGRI
jgi:hypothetical protein